MTDQELVAKKLAEIETYVRQLRELAHPERLAVDVREERFVLYTLQVTIQACLDVASHIVSDERLGEPRTNRDLFDLLVRAGWLPAELAGALAGMARFRNVVVHGYVAVNLGIVRDVLERNLGDFEQFVAGIRRRLATS